MSRSSLPTELYRAKEVRALDRAAIEGHGIAGYELMSRAGAAAARVIRRRWPQAGRVVVAVGGGNNGGDGYVIARLLATEGRSVRLLTLADPSTLRGDAARARDAAGDVGLTAAPFAAVELTGAELVVDALLGTGLERPVKGRWAEAIEAINATGSPVLAADIPSGLHADSGQVLGSAVQAAATVTFIGLKRGLFTGRGPAVCGEVHFDDLSVPPGIYAEVACSGLRYAAEDRDEWLPRRPRDAHKGRYGHVLVAGGDHGMAGAARMAAEAAARCGAGLVSVATRESHAGIQAALRPELMFRGVESTGALQPLLERATVLALGPGLGAAPWGLMLWSALLAADLPGVLDADALNLLAQAPRPCPNWILTPHPGEAARLLACSTAEIETDRFAAAAAIRARYDGVCLLKGAGSIIEAEGGPAHVVQGGNPGMATGGMGDVLTGVIAGLLAQGLEPAVAARLGAWAHAAAGDRAAREGERGLLALDLLPHLRFLLNPV
jgi:NAD(P)H-hydrate epimerase